MTLLLLQMKALVLATPGRHPFNSIKAFYTSLSLLGIQTHHVLLHTNISRATHLLQCCKPPLDESPLHIKRSPPLVHSASLTPYLLYRRNTQTKGVWLWGEPDFVSEGSDGVTTAIIYVDTEGFESTGKSDAYDDRIFALSAIISSLLVRALCVNSDPCSTAAAGDFKLVTSRHDESWLMHILMRLLLSAPSAAYC